MNARTKARIQNGYMSTFSSSDDDSDLPINSEFDSDSSTSTDDELDTNVTKMMIINGRPIKPTPKVKVTSSCKQIPVKINSGEQNGPKSQKRLIFAKRRESDRSIMSAAEKNLCSKDENSAENQRHKTTIMIRREATKFDKDTKEKTIDSERAKDGEKTQHMMFLRMHNQNPVTTIRIQSVKKKIDTKEANDDECIQQKFEDSSSKSNRAKNVLDEEQQMHGWYDKENLLRKGNQTKNQKESMPDLKCQNQVKGELEKNGIFRPENVAFRPENDVFIPKNGVFRNSVFRPENDVFIPKNGDFRNSVFRPENDVFIPKNGVELEQSSQLTENHSFHSNMENNARSSLSKRTEIKPRNEVGSEPTNEVYSKVLRQASARMFRLVGRRIPVENKEEEERKQAVSDKRENLKRIGFLDTLENCLKKNESSCNKVKKEERNSSAFGKSCAEFNEEEEKWPEPPNFDELLSESNAIDEGKIDEGEIDERKIDEGKIDEGKIDEAKDSGVEKDLGDLSQAENDYYEPNENEDWIVKGLEEDSCLLCDILDNEKRLARRSADMDSFRRSAMSDCDKVLKKMENAQKIVRKLSGSGSPLRVSGRKNDVGRKKIEQQASRHSYTSTDSEDVSKALNPTGKQPNVESKSMKTARELARYDVSNERVCAASCRSEGPREVEESERGGLQSAPKNGIRRDGSRNKKVNEVKKDLSEAVGDECLNIRDSQPSVDETQIRKSKKGLANGVQQNLTFETEMQTAARKHCKEIIDFGGYLIPQPSKPQSRPKIKRNISEDFLIVNNMPCSQRIEPSRKNTSHSREKEAFSQNPAPSWNNTPDRTPNQANNVSRPRSTDFHNGYFSLPPPQRQIHNASAVSPITPSNNIAKQNHVAFQTPETRRPHSIYLPSGANSAPNDPTRGVREQNWLKKAARRLRRSLSFEDNAKKRTQKMTLRESPAVKQSTSSGNLASDYEFSTKGFRGRSYSDEGLRKSSIFQSIKSSKKKTTREVENDTHKKDPAFHPKYGYAESTMGNGLSKTSQKGKGYNGIGNARHLSGSFHDQTDMNGNLGRPNGNLKHTNQQYSNMEQATSNMGYSSQAPNQSFLGQNGASSYRHDENWFIAPLQVQAPSRRTASTKVLQSRR